MESSDGCHRNVPGHVEAGETGQAGERCQVGEPGPAGVPGQAGESGVSDERGTPQGALPEYTRDFLSAGFTADELLDLLATIAELRAPRRERGPASRPPHPGGSGVAARADRSAAEASAGATVCVPDSDRLPPRLHPDDWLPWLHLVRRGCEPHRALLAMPCTAAVAALFEWAPPTPSPAIRPARESSENGQPGHIPSRVADRD